MHFSLLNCEKQGNEKEKLGALFVQRFFTRDPVTTRILVTHKDGFTIPCRAQSFVAFPFPEMSNLMFDVSYFYPLGEILSLKWKGN